MNSILKRELYSLFRGPIAYIVIALFLVFSGILFFPTFFIFNLAEMRGFFQLLPILFCFFIPAVTMRSFAEEKRSGTFEALITLPVKVSQIVLAKYLAILLFLVFMLLPTVAYAVMISFLGRLDPGPVLAGYLGAILLGGAYAALGLFASSLTTNQIIAFIITAAAALFLTFLEQMLIFIPPLLVDWVEFLGTQYHFRTIARGVLDTRSILYLISFSALLLLGTIRAVEQRR